MVEEPKSIPMQTEGFVDLITEDGNVITKEEREKAANKVGKEQIELPGQGVLISEFANRLVKRLANEKAIFYRQDSRQIVELGKFTDPEGEITHTGFLDVKPSRFITLIEKYFYPWAWVYPKGRPKFQGDKSMTKDVARTVLDSHIMEEQLPNINRIFTVQTPIIRNGELTFPTIGYDPRFNSWTEKDAPMIEDMHMSLEEAKKILYETFSEFCFESRQDYMNAISALLTPLLRGLYKTGFNTRTPVYAYMANRERSGKDYLAGITGILYEGCALEEPPISNGERGSGNNNEELRKKIVATMLSGRKRFHSSNNRGHMNNSVLESVTTAERYSDRLLGKNENVTFDNELEFSFSGNIGITLTPDLSNRTIFINLFLDVEDANSRKFNNPNLHKWVYENRNKILSALYALIRNWFDNNMPSGSHAFSSFPEWARVCGGVMESAGFDSPCKKDIKQTGISIDSETDEMKELFELCYSKIPNEYVPKQTLKEIIMGSGLMNYIDWSTRSSQTKFAFKLNKFVGRVLSDIRLVVKNREIRPSRWEYRFIKNEGSADKSDIFGEEMVTLGNLGNVCPRQESSISRDSYSSKSLPGLPEVTKTDNSANDDSEVIKMAKEAGFSDEDIKKAGYEE